MQADVVGFAPAVHRSTWRVVVGTVLIAISVSAMVWSWAWHSELDELDGADCNLINVELLR